MQLLGFRHREGQLQILGNVKWEMWALAEKVKNLRALGNALWSLKLPRMIAEFGRKGRPLTLVGGKEGRGEREREREKEEGREGEREKKGLFRSFVHF